MISNSQQSFVVEVAARAENVLRIVRLVINQEQIRPGHNKSVANALKHELKQKECPGVVILDVSSFDSKFAYESTSPMRVDFLASWIKGVLIDIIEQSIIVILVTSKREVASRVRNDVLAMRQQYRSEFFVPLWASTVEESGEIANRFLETFRSRMDDLRALAEKYPTASIADPQARPAPLLFVIAVLLPFLGVAVLSLVDRGLGSVLLLMLILLLLRRVLIRKRRQPRAVTRLVPASDNDRPRRDAYLSLESSYSVLR